METIFGIPLFSWVGWDEVECGHLSFYDCKWQIEAMKKWNGCAVDRKIDGSIIIYDDEGKKVFECFPCDFAEVREAIKWREILA